ncbi:MAG: glycosyltransferase family 2 protein [Bryobacteraceae bacterium]
MRPSVSVIIPIYNSAKYLREAIASVLAQRHSPLEVLVVDDGSSDNGPELASSYGLQVRVIAIPHRGHPAARNAGIAASTGDFLAFLDADDLWTAHKLDLQLEAFDANPSLELVFGHMQNFISLELTEEERAKIKCNSTVLPGLLQGSMLARRGSFERVGPFAEERSMGDFLDWYGRATLLNLNMHMLPDTLVRRRIHLGNFSRTHKHLRTENLLVLKKLLDLRRAAADSTATGGAGQVPG